MQFYGNILVPIPLGIGTLKFTPAKEITGEAILIFQRRSRKDPILPVLHRGTYQMSGP